MRHQRFSRNNVVRRVFRRFGWAKIHLKRGIMSLRIKVVSTRFAHLDLAARTRLLAPAVDALPPHIRDAATCYGYTSDEYDGSARYGYNPDRITVRQLGKSTLFARFYFTGIEPKLDQQFVRKGTV